MTLESTALQDQTFAVKVQCIRQNDGTPPLFMMGDEHVISPLSQYVHGKFSIYAVYSESLARYPGRTIEGVATKMVRIIRSLQPAGPYYLAGHSLAGITAYEIAAQLLGEDEGVAFLALINTHCKPSNELHEVQATNVTEIKDGQEEAPFLSDGVCDQIPGVTPYRKRPIVPAGGGNCPASNAIKQYSVQPIPAMVSLFLTPPYKGEPTLFGWDAVLPRNQIRAVDFSHQESSLKCSSSIEILGQKLSNAMNSAIDSPACVPPCGYEPLVPLQIGRRTALPLICLPGAGATSVSFAELTTCFEQSLPIWGIEPRGLEGALVPHSTVQAAARSCVAYLTRTYPDRALHLLGHSFGGWVAFELAEQLAACGSIIASLTLLDSEAPGAGPVPEYDRTDVLVECIEAFELLLERTLGIGRRDLEFLEEGTQKKLLHHHMVKHGLLPRLSTPDVLNGPLRTFAAALRTRYLPAKPYFGPLRLVLVDSPKLDAHANRQKQENTVEAWRRWAPNVSYFHSSGNHMTVLKAPHVRELGRIIEEVI